MYRFKYCLFAIQNHHKTLCGCIGYTQHTLHLYVYLHSGFKNRIQDTRTRAHSKTTIFGFSPLATIELAHDYYYMRLCVRIKVGGGRCWRVMAVSPYATTAIFVPPRKINPHQYNIMCIMYIHYMNGDKNFKWKKKIRRTKPFSELRVQCKGVSGSLGGANFGPSASMVVTTVT